MNEDRKEYFKKYYKRNPEKHRLWRQRYYYKNKAKIKAYVKKWRQNNLDKVREYHLRYVAKYPERHKQYYKNYRKNKDYSKLPSKLTYRNNNTTCRSKLTKDISQHYYQENKDKIQKLVDLITTHDLEIKKEE